MLMLHANNVIVVYVRKEHTHTHTRNETKIVQVMGAMCGQFVYFGCK